MRQALIAQKRHPKSRKSYAAIMNYRSWMTPEQGIPASAWAGSFQRANHQKPEAVAKKGTERM